MNADEIARIEEITGIRDLGPPTLRGDWATWEQRGSQGLMDQRVSKLKAAGYKAFFSARERRWGVKL